MKGPFTTPGWVHLWNMTVFPITTSITEELVYRGYALPGVVLELLYLRLRRLIPLIVGHYFIDLIFLGIFPFIFA